MKNSRIGRPVDLSGINVREIDLWLKSNKMARKILICQSISSLNKNIPMEDVCKVLGVTREGVRLWKMKLRKEGLKGVLKERKVGKRSKLDLEKRKQLKMVVKKHPEKQGYKTKTWTGKIVQDFVKKKWGFNITIRTAQVWLASVR